VSKSNLWSPSGIFSNIKILQGCTLVTNDLSILGVLVGSHGFVTHFLDEVLFQYVVHINDLFLLGDRQVTLSILSSCVARRPSYLTWIVPPSFMSFLANFNRRVMQVCGDIMGPRSWESI
jgi:hypothetical protein